MQKNWKNILGELNSKNKQITDNSFSTGKVLKMPLTEEDGIVLKGNAKERHKYIAVIGQDKDNSLIGSLLVNSNINENVIKTKKLLDCQFPLKEKDYDFLDHDSYLNCSKLFELSKIEIINKATEEGELTSKDRELVREHILNSEVISTKQKKRFNIVKN
jgi:hypothetical protein